MTVPGGGKWKPDDARQEVRAESGFAYGVVGADLHIFPDRGPLYQLTEFRHGSAPYTRHLLRQPSRLLDARFEIVTFTGRTRELAELSNWRNSSPRLAARWLHAPGGAGKTRLAAEVAADSVARGWKVVVAHGHGSILSSGSQDLRLDGMAGLLLLVDYADRWPASHLSWLFSNALLHQQLPTRLLLLARTSQPWPSISATLEELRADISDFRLPPLSGMSGVGGRERMFCAARDSFAACYGLPDPGLIKPPETLEQPDFALTLAVHMAALVSVDSHARGIGPPEEMAGLSAYLVSRERKHWTDLYESHIEGLDFSTSPQAMARTVFIASLTGATSHTKGNELLHRLDVEGRPDRLMADHAACYPPSDPATVLEPLYPDRLAEDFLALSLPGHGVTGYTAAPWAGPTVRQLTVPVPEGPPPSYISRTVTFLASAAAPDRWPHVATHLNSILRDNPALAVAAGSGALAAVAGVADIDLEVLDAIARHLPEGSHTDLDLGNAALAERRAQLWLTRTDDLPVHAEIHHVLAISRASIGQYAQARVASEQAIAHWREQIVVRPGTHHQSDLALSLMNHAGLLENTARRTEALAAAEEAVGLLRNLINGPVNYNDRFLPLRSQLSSALDRLSRCLAAVDRHAEALTASEEGVAIRRQLHRAAPGRTGQP